VSVVIPTYNASATVAVALASVAFQTFRDYEVIVVDDASLDGTAELVELWIRQCEDSANGQTQSRGQSPHHRIIRLAVNRGPAAARNAGVAAARGGWIAFLDGDDAWLPWRLATQAEALARYPDAVLVCGELALSRGEGPEDVARRLSDPGTAGARDVPLEDFLESNPVPTSTVLARRAALTAAGGFDPRFRGPEDIDLWMRIAAAGRIVRLAAPLAVYRERPGSLSMDPDTFLPQIVRVYEKAFGAGGALHGYRHLRRRAIAARYVSAAWTHAECGQRLKALRRLARSWRLWPGRINVERKRPSWRLRILGKILLNR